MSRGERVAWLDLSAGVAGDMLLGALLDCGASLSVVRAAIDAVLPGSTSLSVTSVQRAGLRACRLSVHVTEPDPPVRRWRDLRAAVERAPISEPVRRDALAVFGALAAAEGRVHGVDAADVHFHEVGAADSVADVVGVCAALEDLAVGTLTAGPLVLGSGQVTSAHGVLPVPVPAVLELADGWAVSGGGTGELATPTGVALVTTLARQTLSMPALRVAGVGVGAGTRDPEGRPNVARVVLGDPVDETAVTAHEVVIEANVDDLDPRVWPAVLTALLEAGAVDAWLTPILMKKGRPAHTVHALAPAALVSTVRAAVFAHTSTIGVREFAVGKVALARTWVAVGLGDATVRVKVAEREHLIVRATPEFEDVRDVAVRRGVAVQDVLVEALAAAYAAGLVPGARLGSGAEPADGPGPEPADGP